MNQTVRWIGLWILACGAAPTQTSGERPVFDVASVKTDTEFHGAYIGGSGAPLPGCRGGPGSADPGHFTCYAAPLASLVRAAYNLRSYQAAFPDWMNRAYFDIAANVPAGSNVEQFRLMQQSLLADRFKLAAHFDKKEMQIYEMTAGKDGPKFKESSADPAAPSAVRAAVKVLGITADENGADYMQRGGRVSHMRKQTMGQLANYLTVYAGRPVVDATGLTATYDIVLNFVQDMGGRGAAADSADSDGGPTLIGAVQAQPGLKLESKKDMIEVLAIDHIEKEPTKN